MFEIQLLQAPHGAGWRWRVIAHRTDCSVNCKQYCSPIADGWRPHSETAFKAAQSVMLEELAKENA